MICPRCGSKLGNLKDYAVIVHKGQVYAQLIPCETYTIDENGNANLRSRMFVCPICDTRFKPKKGENK